MNASNIQQIIEELARQNADMYPESYETEQGEDGKPIFSEEGMLAILTLAKQYYDHRTEEGVGRDKEANVDLEDYVIWVGDAVGEVIISGEYCEKESVVSKNKTTRGVMYAFFANTQAPNCAEKGTDIKPGERFVFHRGLFYSELSTTYQEQVGSAILHDW